MQKWLLRSCLPQGPHAGRAPRYPTGLPSLELVPGARCFSLHGFPVLLQVIFRFALALFKYKEEEILKLQDSMSIFKYLRYFTRTILDAR